MLYFFVCRLVYLGGVLVINKVVVLVKFFKRKFNELGGVVILDFDFVECVVENVKVIVIVGIVLLNFFIK